MRKRSAGILAAATLGVLGLVGCKKTFDQEVKDILMNDYKFTEEQALVGVGSALRWRFMTKTPNGKFEFNYGSMSAEDQLQKLRDVKGTVTSFLDPNDADSRRYLDLFNQRSELERKERVLNYDISRFELVITYKRFEQLMRNIRVPPVQDPRSNPNPANLSDLDILFPGTNLEQILQFTARYVEDARANRRLNSVEDVRISVSALEEEPNPDYPQVDPNNATKWVQRSRSLRIVSYDCDALPDNLADYVEVYRVKDDGTSEMSPAIKVFKSQGSQSLDVAVMDKQRFGERGHGVPEEVREISVARGSEIYDNYREVLQNLFKRPEAERRQIPRESPIRASIVRVGEVEQSEYVTNPAGWSVPAEYKDRIGNNYTLWVKFADDPNADPHQARARSIEYVARRFVMSGTRNDVAARVVEYYRVKPEFAGNVRLATVDNRNRTMQIFQDGRANASNLDSFFLQSDAQGKPVPFRIEYDTGTLRVTIEDRDNNATPLYEAKKEVTRPHDVGLRNDAQVSGR